MRDDIEGYLKRTCRLTGAAWAALTRSVEGKPQVEASCFLSPRRIEALERWLATSPGASWYGRPARRGAARSIDVPAEIRLGASRLWSFAAKPGTVLLVGGNELGPGGSGTWTLLAPLLEKGSVEPLPAGPLPLEASAAYESGPALDGILAAMVEGSGQDAGWLAIRRGERLVITASRPTGSTLGAVLDMQSNPLLVRMRKTRAEVRVLKGEPEWEKLPDAVGRRIRHWSARPLVVGDRLIGAVGIWGARAPSAERGRALRLQARHAAQQVDLVVSLSELTSQLRRLATLNEFALAISSAEELPQLARRVLDHLSAIFSGKRTSVLVAGIDGSSLQEFTLEAEDFRARVMPRSGHPLEALFDPGPYADPTNTGRGAGDATESEATPLTLPLRYRETIVGALVLEGLDVAAISRYDRSMLTVVASYMAGVVEHARLRVDAVDRARRLEQTVEQLREAELVASSRLLAQQTAENRLVQAAKLAAVGEMAAGVAHELNNPLTTVAGFAELILDETPADAPYRGDLEMVLHEARRARSVVRRLLDFARQGESMRARTDINEVVEDVLALTRHFIHTSGVQLEVALGSQLPWIQLDSNQIKQVLLNLLHNALHAMPAGGRLEVATERAMRRERDGIIVRVTDTGTGMEMEEIQRIFDPFYTTRADSGGTGLGLSVTYGIVTEHGGTIEVESQRGHGSTFTVWLPL